MSVASFIKKNFIGKELHFYLGEESEMVVLEQSWVANKEIVFGNVIDVDEDIIILQAEGKSIVYLNPEEVKMFWGDDFNYHRHVRAHITKKSQGAK